jgi:hypothetical protein
VSPAEGEPPCRPSERAVTDVIAIGFSTSAVEYTIRLIKTSDLVLAAMCETHTVASGATAASIRLTGSGRDIVALSGAGDTGDLLLILPAGEYTLVASATAQNGGTPLKSQADPHVYVTDWATARSYFVEDHAQSDSIWSKIRSVGASPSRTTTTCRCSIRRAPSAGEGRSAGRPFSLRNEARISVGRKPATSGAWGRPRHERLRPCSDGGEVAMPFGGPDGLRCRQPGPRSHIIVRGTLAA